MFIVGIWMVFIDAKIGCGERSQWLPGGCLVAHVVVAVALPDGCQAGGACSLVTWGCWFIIAWMGERKNCPWWYHGYLI